MSFSKEKRERIISYLLEKIEADDTDALKKVSENFEITMTSVRRYMYMLQKEKVVKKDEKKKCGYILVSKTEKLQFENVNLDESNLYFQEIEPRLPDMSEEARRVWAYVFTEICNNAIEHSQGSEIQVEIRTDALNTEIVIQDDGVGIFRHVAQALAKDYGYPVEARQAVIELFKGKYTTNKELHSGEGIFFSSKLADCFLIQSDGCLFRECLGDNEIVVSHLLSYYHKLSKIGTRVIMRVSNQTKASTKELFEHYCDDDFHFCKSRIPVREINPMAFPVSRSEARRMLNRMEQFTDITLDFKDVEEMGQGFAHEVFIVFHKLHPDIKLHVENASPMVQRMIQHVKRNSADIS